MTEAPARPFGGFSDWPSPFSASRSRPRPGRRPGREAAAGPELEEGPGGAAGRRCFRSGRGPRCARSSLLVELSRLRAGGRTTPSVLAAPPPAASARRSRSRGRVASARPGPEESPSKWRVRLWRSHPHSPEGFNQTCWLLAGMACRLGSARCYDYCRVQFLALRLKKKNASVDVRTSFTFK